MARAAFLRHSTLWSPLRFGAGRLGPRAVHHKPGPGAACGKGFAQERAVRGDGGMRDVLRHMMIIREFESMLGNFKSTGA